MFYYGIRMSLGAIGIKRVRIHWRFRNQLEKFGGITLLCVWTVFVFISRRNQLFSLFPWFLFACK